MWQRVGRADPRAAALADRHYSRKTPGSKHFTPPGRCMVLYTSTATGEAVWVTSWPYTEFVKHAWPGAWMCSLFRNENAGIASELIVAAVEETVRHFGPPPDQGMITLIDRRKVRPVIVRGEPVWGWTFRKGGFRVAGETKSKLLVLQWLPQTGSRVEVMA